MNQIEIGKFIAKCRKEKKITQAQLAEKLNITDRAVSKWETGKSMPDSSIMLELYQLLGITVNELLSGEKVNMDSLERKADENLIALKKKVDNNIAKNIIIAVLFSVILFIGILVCTICDIAVSGSLSWSLIPIISIIFVWLISFPSIMFGKKGIVKSLISLSIFVVPYIYLLSRLIKVKTVSGRKPKKKQCGSAALTKALLKKYTSMTEWILIPPDGFTRIYKKSAHISKI